jgi:thymidylate synthase
LDLLKDVLHSGVRKPQRAVLRDGRRPDVLSVFGKQIRFNLNEGFPLVTTKYVPFHQVVHELLWFLSGSTNNNDLEERGVTIWREWADPETGELGPIYGKQWRCWEGTDGTTIDQIALLVQGIREVIVDPHASVARRLILTAWNPAEIANVRGPSGCHTLAQFNLTDGRLSCQLYQRSADMFLGVPWNIASYALLTHLFAAVSGVGVGEFIHTFGDAHIYENHIEQVHEQLTRTPYPLPTLRLYDVQSMDDLSPDQIQLEGYRSHPRLRGEVAI